MTTIPTDEQIRQEIHQTIEANPKFKQCINCIHYNRVTSMCDEKHMKMYPYVPGCNSYDTAEELLLRKAKEELTAQARECEKIEFLLAMALTSANMTSLIIEDFERRVKTVYKREKGKEKAGHLRKDLDLAEQMDKAMKRIEGFLEKIEQQYRFYIQSHLDKIFKKEGVYNVEAHDQFHSDAGEFATFLLEMARVAHHNQSNADKVYEFMHTLRNLNVKDEDNTFCLDDKDIAHYRLKE